MLGQALMEEFQASETYAVTGWDREDIDLTDFDALDKALLEAQPDIVINVAAYNAVDQCEDDDMEYAKALLLNAKLPEFLAKKSAEMGYTVVHYSTDYVFDGALEENKAKDGCCGGGCCGAGGSQVGYDEESLPNPISRYGTSKYLGEEGVRKNAKQYYLIRLSKLFGKPALSAQGKKSFFEVMLGAGKTKEIVQAVDDEKSCFTYAPDLATATRELIENAEPSGIYHLANTGPATWYEAVRELYTQAQIGVTIEPVPAGAFPRKAKRPRCSVLLNTKRPQLRPYQEALREYLSKM
jgi:dTDP-4-dehydrorhamnose reductase